MVSCINVSAGSRGFLVPSLIVCVHVMYLCFHVAHLLEKAVEVSSCLLLACHEVFKIFSLASAFSALEFTLF